MSLQPLDNPIWASLTSLHQPLALGRGPARRYPREVAPFLGVPDSEPIDPGALTELIDPEEKVFLVGPRPHAPSRWAVEDLGHLSQMVCDAALPELPGPRIVPLTESNRPAVLELTALVYPHYFRPRTMELGRYFGIFEGSRL